MNVMTQPTGRPGGLSLDTLLLGHRSFPQYHFGSFKLECQSMETNPRPPTFQAVSFTIAHCPRPMANMVCVDHIIVSLYCGS